MGMLYIFNNLLKNKIALCFIILLAFCQFTMGQTISGSDPVETNSTHTYAYQSSSALFSPNWEITGGTLNSSSSHVEAGIHFYNAQVTWGSVGSGVVKFKTWNTVADTKNITITAVAGPDTPTMPTIENFGGYTTLTRSNPPSGEVWYWQDSDSGESTTNSDQSVDRPYGTTQYFLKSYNSTTLLWSTAREINYNVDFSDENYVRTITPRQPVTNTNTLANNQKIETIGYFDGLGRPMQNIGIRAGGNGDDIITHIGYDDFGRQTKEYLPYSLGSNSGLYKTDALSATNTHYETNYSDDINANSPNPYSEKEIEASPLSRVLKQAAPGEDWALGNGHEIEFDYLTNTFDSNNPTNTNNDNVRLYKVSLSFANNTYTPALVLDSGTNGYYAESELYKTITIDENNASTEEFKDKQGRVVLKRNYNLVGSPIAQIVPHDTYYVYDDYGNLTYVLPPKAEAQDAKPDATELLELCYQYKYDNRNRLVEKRIPGKGLEYIVYNLLDKPVFTQDANLRAQNKWLLTKYDAYGRVAFTGIHNSANSRVGLQKYASNQMGNIYTQFVKKITFAQTIAGTTLYYSNTAVPYGIHEILTINYYDNYTFDGFTSLPPSHNNQDIINNDNTDQVKTRGLATCSKVRVLDSNPVTWITTITGYDTKGRPIYIKSDNDYLETTDVVKSTLDFTGQVLETTTTHNFTWKPTITTVDSFTYDHAGRLLSQKQKINNLDEELITLNSYDDIGQLVSKKVGGDVATTIDNSEGLQAVDYDYNIRGWLKQINDPNSLGDDLFGFKLNYNTIDMSGSDSSPLYNGNISETIWKTANDASSPSNFNRGYSYQYDALNRITRAYFRTKNTSGNYMYQNYAEYNLDKVAYDKNGNIASLRRYANHGYYSIDYLTYAYDSGNKLLSVTDSGSSYKSEGFKDGTNTGDDYTYDANGNMLTDANKGITSITYNYLNLPTEVTINNSENNGSISYIYDATGVKLKKKVTTVGTNIDQTLYAGNYIYKYIPYTADYNLSFFNHPEGYVEPDGSSNYKYVYQYKDHLGNVRLSYKGTDTTTTLYNFNDGTTNGWGSFMATVINDSNTLKITTQSMGTYKYIPTEVGQTVTLSLNVDKGTTDKVSVRAYYGGKIADLTQGVNDLTFTATRNGIYLMFVKDQQSSDVGTSTDFYIDDLEITLGSNLTVLEENNYYPFGLKHKGYNNVINGTDHKYGFGGKEEQDELGLGWIDITARNYDPALGRWMNIDPLAENGRRWSPYNFAFDNPIYFQDPDGMWPFPNSGLQGYVLNSVKRTLNNVKNGDNLLVAALKSFRDDPVVEAAADELPGAGESLDVSKGNYGSAALGIIPFGKKIKKGVELASDAIKTTKKTSKAARREAMREAGIPTSQPLIPDKATKSKDKVFVTRDKKSTVQDAKNDVSHKGEPHWEAGPTKKDVNTPDGLNRSGNNNKPQMGKPKSKAEYDE